MATYTLFTASYGSNYANLRVRILDQVTGTPAIIMASAASGLLSSNGNAVLDSSGNLSVYTDNAKTFQVWNNQFLLTPSSQTIAIEIQRTAAQLAGTPSLADIGLGTGATFYLDTAPDSQYRINANRTAYTLITGSGSGVTTFSALSDKITAPIATTNTSVSGALSTLTGNVSTLTSSVASLSTTVSSKVSNVGIFVNSSALQIAFPAASNTGNSASVGSSVPYTNYVSNGSAWVVSGSGGGASAGSATPSALGSAASAGTATNVSHEDHVHLLPTALQVGGIPQISGTYNASTNTVTSGPLNGYQPVSSTVPAGGPPAFQVTVAGTPSLDSVGTLQVGDMLYQTGTTWGRIAGAPTSTALFKGDGTGGFVSAVVGVDYLPGPLFQSGITLGVMPSCTVASGGVITFTTTTPTAIPGGAWMWYSATALSGTSLAGWYWTVLAGSVGNAATSGQVYNNYLPSTGTSAQQAGTSNGATIASTWPVATGLTTTGITGGTHTQPVSTGLFAPGPSVPAGYLGNNGSCTFRYLLRNNGTSFAKTFSAFPLGQSTAPTTALRSHTVQTIMNRGVANVQIAPNLNDGSSIFDDPITTTDTSAAWVVNPRFFFASGSGGNDYQVIEYFQMTLIPRA